MIDAADYRSGCEDCEAVRCTVRGKEIKKKVLQAPIGLDVYIFILVFAFPFYEGINKSLKVAFGVAGFLLTN